MSKPSTESEPLVGGVSRMSRRAIVLPQPGSPTRPSTSPSPIVKDTLSTDLMLRAAPPKEPIVLHEILDGNEWPPRIPRDGSADPVLAVCSLTTGRALQAANVLRGGRAFCCREEILHDVRLQVQTPHHLRIAGATVRGHGGIPSNKGAR
jgi:hypothetical protein